MTTLYPPGVTSVCDVPFDLQYAIEHAQRILSWQENIPSEDHPPRWMWDFEDELESHFELVKQRRDEKYGGGGSSTAPQDWDSNTLTAGRGRNA